jgi:hypothetical protein
MSALAGCPHRRPPCPSTVTRWLCQRRSDAEELVRRGALTREAAQQLLTRYGVPMTPVSATEHWTDRERKRATQARLL